METDTEQTSNPPTGTQDTIGSSELNTDEAAAITQSMDKSIAFWGYSLDPPDKIPASRLKCGLHYAGKATSVALKIWEKMTQRDLDKVKKIEIALMREGEIGTIDLLHGLKSIIEGIGLPFEGMLKSVDNDPLESIIALTNQILHIFNQNEPPEIVEEEESSSFVHYRPAVSIAKRLEKQKRETAIKMKYLLTKAQRLGLSDIKVPSSPYLTERSKLSLIERQLKAKMKVKNVQRALGRTQAFDPVCDSLEEPKYSQSFRYTKQRISAQQKEPKRSSLTDRPKFRTAVKAQSLRYEDLIKHAPDLSKRMKRVHEIRKKFMEKNKINGGNKNSHNVYNVKNPKSHHYASPFGINAYNQSYKGRSPKPRKMFHLSSTSNCCLRDYDSEESNTKINITIESNDAKNKDGNRFSQPCPFNNFQSCKQQDRPPSREDMLLEMKKMIKEAVQEVTMSSTLNHNYQIFGDKKNKDMKNDQTQKDAENDSEEQPFKTVNRSEDAKSAVKKQTENDTTVTVTQEAGMLPFRQITNNKEENAVSTEVMVSKANGGQALKVSVVSKLSGQDLDTDDAYRPRSRDKHVQEAINVLKEYLALNNNEHFIPNETDESGKEVDCPQLVRDDSNLEEVSSLNNQTVATTEIIIEPDSDDDENGEAQVDIAEETKSALEEDIAGNDGLPTVQAYTVTMFMPIGATDEMRSYSPFQFGGVVLNRPYSSWMSDEIGDIGDTGLSPWNNPIWHTSDMDDSFIPRVRNESDSLYVNTSEERIIETICGDENFSFQSQMSSSNTSITAVARNEEEDYRRAFMSRTVLLFYRAFMNSVFGVFGVILKPFTLMKLFWTTNSNDENQSS